MKSYVMCQEHGENSKYNLQCPYLLQSSRIKKRSFNFILIIFLIFFYFHVLFFAGESCSDLGATHEFDENPVLQLIVDSGAYLQRIAVP